MAPYQKGRRATHQKRVISELDIAREIQKQNLTKLWHECLAEAKKELGRRW